MCMCVYIYVSYMYMYMLCVRVLNCCDVADSSWFLVKGRQVLSVSLPL